MAFLLQKSDPWIEHSFAYAASHVGRHSSGENNGAASVGGNNGNNDDDDDEYRHNPLFDSQPEAQTENTIPSGLLPSPPATSEKEGAGDERGIMHRELTTAPPSRQSKIVQIMEHGGDFDYFEDDDNDDDNNTNANNASSSAKRIPPYLLLHDGHHSALAFLSPEAVAGLRTTSGGGGPSIPSNRALVSINHYTIATVLQCCVSAADDAGDDDDDIDNGNGNENADDGNGNGNNDNDNDNNHHLAKHDRIIQSLFSNTSLLPPAMHRQVLRNIHPSLFLALYLQAPLTIIGAENGGWINTPTDVHASATLRKVYEDDVALNNDDGDDEAGGGAGRRRRRHDVLINRLACCHCGYMLAKSRQQEKERSEITTTTNRRNDNGDRSPASAASSHNGGRKKKKQYGRRARVMAREREEKGEDDDWPPNWPWADRRRRPSDRIVGAEEEGAVPKNVDIRAAAVDNARNGGNGGGNGGNGPILGNVDELLANGASQLDALDEENGSDDDDDKTTVLPTPIKREDDLEGVIGIDFSPIREEQSEEEGAGENPGYGVHLQNNERGRGRGNDDEYDAEADDSRGGIANKQRQQNNEEAVDDDTFIGNARENQNKGNEGDKEVESGRATATNNSNASPIAHDNADENEVIENPGNDVNSRDERGANNDMAGIDNQEEVEDSERGIGRNNQQIIEEMVYDDDTTNDNAQEENNGNDDDGKEAGSSRTTTFTDEGSAAPMIAQGDVAELLLENFDELDDILDLDSEPSSQFQRPVAVGDEQESKDAMSEQNDGGLENEKDQSLPATVGDEPPGGTMAKQRQEGQENEDAMSERNDGGLEKEKDLSQPAAVGDEPPGGTMAKQLQERQENEDAMSEQNYVGELQKETGILSQESSTGVNNVASFVGIDDMIVDDEDSDDEDDGEEEDANDGQPKGSKGDNETGELLLSTQPESGDPLGGDEPTHPPEFTANEDEVDGEGGSLSQIPITTKKKRVWNLGQEEEEADEVDENEPPASQIPLMTRNATKKQAERPSTDNRRGKHPQEVAQKDMPIRDDYKDNRWRDSQIPLQIKKKSPKKKKSKRRQRARRGQEDECEVPMSMRKAPPETMGKTTKEGNGGNNGNRRVSQIPLLIKKRPSKSSEQRSEQQQRQHEEKEVEEMEPESQIPLPNDRTSPKSTMEAKQKADDQEVFCEPVAKGRFSLQSDHFIERQSPPSHHKERLMQQQQQQQRTSSSLQKSKTKGAVNSDNEQDELFDGGHVVRGRSSLQMDHFIESQSPGKNRSRAHRKSSPSRRKLYDSESSDGWMRICKSPARKRKKSKSKSNVQQPAAASGDSNDDEVSESQMAAGEGSEETVPPPLPGQKQSAATNTCHDEGDGGIADGEEVELVELMGNSAGDVHFAAKGSNEGSLDQRSDSLSGVSSKAARVLGTAQPASAAARRDNKAVGSHHSQNDGEGEIGKHSGKGGRRKKRKKKANSSEEPEIIDLVRILKRAKKLCRGI